MGEGEEVSYAPKQSLFNSTISQLMRIDDLWKLAHSNSRSGQFKEWNAVLDRVFCELSEDAKPEDELKFWNLFKDISKTLDNTQLYIILLKKEFFLRKLQNKQGKGVAYKESEESYMSD